MPVIHKLRKTSYVPILFRCESCGKISVENIKLVSETEYETLAIASRYTLEQRHEEGVRTVENAAQNTLIEIKLNIRNCEYMNSKAFMTGRCPFCNTIQQWATVYSKKSRVFDRYSTIALLVLACIALISLHPRLALGLATAILLKKLLLYCYRMSKMRRLKEKYMGEYLSYAPVLAEDVAQSTNSGGHEEPKKI